MQFNEIQCTSAARLVFFPLDLFVDLNVITSAEGRAALNMSDMTNKEQCSDPFHRGNRLTRCGTDLVVASSFWGTVGGMMSEPPEPLLTFSPKNLQLMKLQLKGAKEDYRGDGAGWRDPPGSGCQQAVDSPSTRTHTHSLLVAFETL